MPSILEALNLAEQALGAGDVSRAQLIFEQILKAVPDEPRALNGLGVVAFRAGRLNEAESYHHRAIALLPDDPAFHNNLSLICRRQGRALEAVEHCRRALALLPDSAELHNNLGLAFKQSGRLEPAVASFRRAIELRPDYHYAHYNLGVTLVHLRRLDEAGDAYSRALALAPSDPDMHFSQAMLWLLEGDFARGWPDLEWRFGTEGFSQPSYVQPRWQGEPLDGRTMLLVGEQGLGDVIQMIRFAPLVKQRGATVLVECWPALHALFKSVVAVDRLLSPGEANQEAFDFHIPLLSLPGVLGTTLETIPATRPYLFAEPARVEHWRTALGHSPGLKVGIVWQGRPTFGLDVFRSIPLANFAPLAACPGVRLFSLQVGHGREQLDQLPPPGAIADLGDELHDFCDTAAAMRNLDLVITCDSAPAHLAGALGVPVWVALPSASDWRWLVDRDDSPWYPTMRLFRQSHLGDWDGAFVRIAAALRSLVESRSQP